MRLFAVFIILILFTSSSALSISQNTELTKPDDKSFYDDSKRGWFWYEDPPPIEDKKIEETPPNSGAPSQMKTAEDFNYQELFTMYPPQFQEIYDNTLNKAMMSRTTEDVRDYMLMNDIARRRSSEFAEIATYVSSTTPQFNTLKDFPMVTPGRRSYIAARTKAVKDQMQQAPIDDQYALLFFYSPTCSHCKEQAKILSLFTREHGWEIKPINILEKPNLALEFNIEITPTTLLIQKDNPTPYPVAYGVQTVQGLQRNIYRGIRILAGGPSGMSNYDFQKGSSFDPNAIKNKKDITTYGGVPAW